MTPLISPAQFREVIPPVTHEFMDKNGRKIEAGQTVRLCQTQAHYEEPHTGVVEFIYGVMFVDFGTSSYSLSRFRNSDTNYYSVEII